MDKPERTRVEAVRSPEGEWMAISAQATMGFGGSVFEAVGRLIMENPEEFGVEVVLREGER